MILKYDMKISFSDLILDPFTTLTLYHSFLKNTILERNFLGFVDKNGCRICFRQPLLSDLLDLYETCSAFVIRGTAGYHDALTVSQTEYLLGFVLGKIEKDVG